MEIFTIFNLIINSTVDSRLTFNNSFKSYD